MGSMQHVPPSRPLRFDAYDPEWDLGQSSRHLNLCILLREILLDAVTLDDTVGTDAFMFFDETNADAKCAPDAFVKLGAKKAHYDSWKTWERGVPELCIEILSPSDTKEPITAETKLERFQAMGVREVLFFDVDAPAGGRIRAWDRIGTKLVPRVVTAERTPCKTLGLWFHVGALDDEPVALVLADQTGTRPVPTRDQARRAAEVRASAEAEARKAAEARIRELEERLRSKE